MWPDVLRVCPRCEWNGQNLGSLDWWRHDPTGGEAVKEPHATHFNRAELLLLDQTGSRAQSDLKLGKRTRASATGASFGGATANDSSYNASVIGTITR